MRAFSLSSIDRAAMVGNSRTSGEDSSTSLDQSRPSSPATSISQSLAEGQDQCLVSQFEKEKISFLADLANYVPLGCVIYPFSTEFDHIHQSCEPESWRDITDFSFSLAKHLSKLAQQKLIRIFCKLSSDSRHVILRVYLLPHDAGRRFVDRDVRKTKLALEQLLSEIDVSTSTWSGSYDSENAIKFDCWAEAEDCSLFYMFNTLPSPSPMPDAIRDRFTRTAVQELLDPEIGLSGLKTTLYPYQRRAAATMLERESSPSLILDPRLEQRCTPTMQKYYYDVRQQEFYKNARYFDSLRGGILAETMGLGIHFRASYIGSS